MSFPATKARKALNQLTQRNFFNKKSSFFTLSDGDGIDQICPKLGKIAGMFEAW